MTNETAPTEVPPAAAPAEATAGTEEESKPKAKPTQPVPRPDRKALEKATGALQADIDKINEEIKGYDAGIDKIKKEIESLTSARSGEMDEVGKERAKRDEIRAEMEKLKKERDELAAEFERLKGKVDTALESSKNAKAQLKFRTTQEIDAEIARLEREQSTTSMPLAAEKKLIKELELLRGQKRQLASLGKSQDTVKNDKEERTRVGAELKAKRDEVSACNARLNEQRQVVEKLVAAKEGGPKGKIPGLVEERKALSEKKKEAVGRIKEIKEQISKKWEEFKAKQKEWNAWMDEERKVRDAERKARQEEYLRKQEEEEAKKVPYEEEMALCDYLVKYLQQTFLLNNDNAPAAAGTNGSAAASGNGSALENDGVRLQAFKRDDDDEEMWAGGAVAKKNKGKAAAAGGKKKKDTINHSVDTLASFALLQLEAPAKTGAVEASITALKEKKAWYSVQPRPPRKTAEERAAELAEKEKAREERRNAAAGEVGAKEGGAKGGAKEEGGKPKREKKAPKEFKSSEDDFPALGGAAPVKAEA